MNTSRAASTFACAEAHLVGIRTLPDQPSTRGVLIVVGGPQYRIGSHRQFVTLADGLATDGFPALRFDVRGMGDSTGEIRPFDDTADDIRHALDHFFSAVPTLEKVVLLGLCDGATASLLYAHGDPRVAGMVLLNPWARTEAGQAKTYLKHYYVSRLFQRSFWQKALAGRLNYWHAASSLLRQARTAARTTPLPGAKAGPGCQFERPSSLPDQMAMSLSKFNGRVLIVLSGHDLTAREFDDLSTGSLRWKRLMAQKLVQTSRLPDADHTFSRLACQEKLLATIQNWMRSW